MSEVVKLTIVPDSSEHDTESQPRILTVGEKLALARTNLDLSVDQVAGQLKWSARQISEIEAGHYSVFPDMLTVRGFVRTYAKILKIDSTALLDELANEYEKLPSKPIDRPKLDTPFPTGRMPILGRHHNNSQKLVGAAILLFLCFVMIIVYRAELQKLAHSILGSEPEKVVIASEATTSVPATIEKPVAEPAPEIQTNASGSTLPTSETKTVVEQAALPPVPVNQHEASVASSSSNENPAVDSTRLQSKQSDQQKNQQNSEIPESESLRFSFKQDSWIQIKNSSGAVIASQLYRAGSEEVFRVKEPLNIVVGNAPGVVAKLRGLDLVLPLQPGSNVVNLSVK